MIHRKQLSNTAQHLYSAGCRYTPHASEGFRGSCSPDAELVMKNVFIGTVEGDLEDTAREAVVEAVKNAGYKKVVRVLSDGCCR